MTSCFLGDLSVCLDPGRLGPSWRHRDERHPIARSLLPWGQTVVHIILRRTHVREPQGEQPHDLVMSHRRFVGCAITSTTATSVVGRSMLPDSQAQHVPGGACAERHTEVVTENTASWRGSC
jgi:hypothetical protein